jgi:hypothetical protein
MQPNQYVDANGNPKPDAPAAQNQFTTGKRTKHDDATRDKMRAEHLARRLYHYVTDTEDEVTGQKVELDSTKIAAAKILIDKGKPNLQAVEQTNKNEMDDMSPEEIREHVRALILAHPELIREISQGPTPVETSTKQVQQG